MVLKIWKPITAFCAEIVLILLISGGSRACGIFELGEDFRIAMFRATLEKMLPLQPFYYSSEYYNTAYSDPSVDFKRNCADWQQAMGKDVRLEDIMVILNNTPANFFLNAYEQKRLGESFSGNTFIARLLTPAYSRYLHYLVLSKKIEFNQVDNNFDSWYDENYTYSLPEDLRPVLNECNSRLKSEKNSFLIKRYRYQVVRLYERMGMTDSCLIAFKNYFPKEEDHILYAWVLQYYALALDEAGRNIEANYYYSRVFELSDEKKFRVFQCFNRQAEVVSKTLELAKNDYERSVILSMTLMHYPGPALDKIRTVMRLSPKNPYLELLVMREINKLEDWLLTPYLTGYAPSVYRWDEDKLVAERNKQKDEAYLVELRGFLEQSTHSSMNEDFRKLAIAHLYLMNKEEQQAVRYMGMISPEAEKAILLQQGLQEILLVLGEPDINQLHVQEIIALNMNKLERNSYLDPYENKTLFSVMRQISKSYKKAGNIPLAGLAFMKGEKYKYIYSQFYYSYMDDYGEWCRNYYYGKIAYFDVNAGTADIDNLLVIKNKKNKNKLEEFLCDQPLADDYAYLDLKGTIAFREDKLEMALAAFSQIPDSFWKTSFSFKDYLNEDPFIAKNLCMKRKFNYSFSKTEFVKELMALKAAAKNPALASATDLMRLAHAYYNCSFYGNSWMMNSYYWNSGPFQNFFSLEDDIYGNANFRVKEMNPDYFTAAKAEYYYRQALHVSRDPELSAKACYMLVVCELNKGNKGSKSRLKSLAGMLLGKYVTTSFIKSFSCPLLYDYL